LSKLSTDEKFIDFSDYGRPIAVTAANYLKKTPATPVQITLLFGVCGLMAVYSILSGYYITAGILLVLKSIIDAVDGELARAKKTPSYTGRYLDSVFDIILNILIIGAIWYVTESALWAATLAFIGLQLQGTLYNYYYVILRHQSENGDKTSNIFEYETPTAYPREKQKTVNRLFTTYKFFYSLFDKAIYKIDRNAPDTKPFPKWFMSLLSLYGLGFQLLIIAVMLALGFIQYIIPFFIIYSFFILLFVMTRKVFLNEIA